MGAFEDADRLAEAALAASARIGRDVDGGPGARPLGPVGREGVEVRLVAAVPGTRRALFRYAAHVVTWTPADTSWAFWGPALRDHALDVPTWARAVPGHPDQLSGASGAVRTSFVEVRRPARVVRRWDWVRPDGAGETDVVTTTLDLGLREGVDSDGEPVTTVTLRHTGVPPAWGDDLATWWAYQLDMADYRDLGSG